MRKKFAALKTWQKLWLVTLIGGWWVWGFAFSLGHGNQEYLHTDSSTEHMTIFAGHHYVEHGFFEHYLLPTYPPFGFDDDRKPRTVPFVYNHYLAGQDLVMGVLMKMFGENGIWLSRLVPLTLTVGALAMLTLELGAFIGAASPALLLLTAMLLPRSLTVWSICIYGHGHVMAFYLWMVAGLLWLANRKGGRPREAWLFGIAIGVLQMFFDFDWVPLTAVSCASFACLMAPRLGFDQGRRVLGGLVVGGFLAGVYQLVISTLDNGSLTWVVKNIAHWLTWRSGAWGTVGTESEVSADDLRISHLWQEFDRQTYGATGFTAMNLVGLSAMMLLFGFWGRVRTLAETVRGFGALVLAYVAAVGWSLTMRQHALAHIRFISRHYFVLYLTFTFLAVTIGYDLVRAARKTARVPATR